MNKTGASRVPRSRHVSASKVCLHVTFLPVIYRPQTKFAKVMFYTCLSVHRGVWYPSMPCRWYPSMFCSRSPGGGGVMCIPAWLAGFQAHTQGGLEWSGLGGVSRSTPRGEFRGLTWGGVLQAHTLEGWEGGSPGPQPGGSPDSRRGSPGPHLRGGGIPACTEADPAPADSYCCGRYASYWNAFLFSALILEFHAR